MAEKTDGYTEKVENQTSLSQILPLLLLKAQSASQEMAET